MFFAAAAVAAAATGCGDKDTSTMPTSPSTSPAAATSPGPATTAGATIAGTVVGVATASSSNFQAQGITLTVTVTGSSSMATVDSSGRFMLTNVPAGRIDLHFVGNGVDAHLPLDVAERANLTITVRVSEHDAHLEDNHANPGPGNGQPNAAEVEGRINAGSLAGSCAAHNLSFTVGTTKVLTNASTQFKDTRCDALKGNSEVEVKGTRQSDGSILAASVEGDDEDENENENEDRNEVELKGAIAAGSLAGSCAASNLSFRVSSTLVKTNASTQFKDTACASLKAGDAVEVKGARQTDNSVLATRVEQKS